MCSYERVMSGRLIIDLIAGNGFVDEVKRKRTLEQRGPGGIMLDVGRAILAKAHSQVMPISCYQLIG
jgi:hypothetical protein